MMDLILNIVFFIVGIISGFLISLYFYRKERKENKANAKILKQIRQYVGAQIRLGKDKRGKIVQRKDGTIAIDWTLELDETVGVSAKPKVEVGKKKS